MSSGTRDRSDRPTLTHPRSGLAFPGVVALYLLTASPIVAQGLLSPGSSALPPVGQQPGSAGPAPSQVAPPTAPSGPGRALPSLRLPGTGIPGATGTAPDADPGAASSPQRPGLPAPRPVPLPPSLPPAEAAARLRRVIELAWERSPELAGVPGRQAAATARAAAAGSITPGPPSAGGGFTTDGFSNRRGGREFELSVATPLWLPGEGAASVRAANADLARLTAQQEAQRLVVAGEVREALALVALAQVELAGVEARLRDARTLEADIGRRVRGREAAEAELLTARLDRFEVEVAQRERRAALENARLMFTALTGVEPDAGALNETAPVAPARGAASVADGQLPANGLGHPRLAEANAAVAVAEANRRLAALQSRDSPEIGVIGRSERDPGSNRYDNRAGLQFRLPFATEARNAPRRAAAEADLTEAVAASTNVRRQVDLQVARARIELDAVEEGLKAARQRVAVLRQQRGLADTAYRAGQIALADAIRVRAFATESEVAQGRAEVATRQARSRVRQAMGLLP